ncbi:helix-turn-helix domain-containing protein [Conexibacter sp. JD483]|uniref:TetR/AcrR family transcriptional regulator n=1 Tax=unclassified Conexibacter TaxID=2627773 RepID=UPI00271EC479|nr:MULTISPECIES: TetR/AcrR family transcriptional regulator [unclassified Conexibacter]MDO8189360.1 helix-turn-helix domain-containing protein [Conexibacter sp. CPCC 205706]MDO8197363.1 helix-turn-helix domain-containing protein [Conexibacter sp. CPCC 205762]MDR9372539.1 helix-turn-helix domain-containing protein [Conexibacter sp. JD483]
MTPSTSRPAARPAAAVPATARGADRRQAILDAALAVFLERGFDAATIEAVRDRSGASTGSIYHFFGSKERLAAALYGSALADYEQGVVALLAPDPAPAAGVRALVRHHLRWVEQRPELARFLFARRSSAVRAASADEVERINARAADALAAWAAPHVRAKHLRRLPPELFRAILLGPAQEFARAWLRDAADSTIEQATRAFGAAAVAALVLDA